MLAEDKMHYGHDIDLKLCLQEEGVDDPNFVDAFNAYSLNGTASGLPVYVNFGQIEDFEVCFQSQMMNFLFSGTLIQRFLFST